MTQPGEMIASILPALVIGVFNLILEIIINCTAVAYICFSVDAMVGELALWHVANNVWCYLLVSMTGLDATYCLLCMFMPLELGIAMKYKPWRFPNKTFRLVFVALYCVEVFSYFYDVAFLTEIAP